MQLLKVTELSGLSKRSIDSVRRDSDSGALPTVHVGQERLFEVQDAVLYALKHRVGITLNGFDHRDACQLASSVTKMDRAQFVQSYQLIDLFCGLADDAGRSEVAAAILKFRVPLFVTEPVEKVHAGGIEKVSVVGNVSKQR